MSQIPKNRISLTSLRHSLSSVICHLLASTAQVVQVRSRSMAAAASKGDTHGMLSVVGLPDADLERICTSVLGSYTHPPAGGGMMAPVCKIANFMFPQVIVGSQGFPQVTVGSQGVLNI